MLGLKIKLIQLSGHSTNDDLYDGRFLKSFMTRKIKKCLEFFQIFMKLKLSAVVHERFGAKAEVKKKIEKIIKIRKK